MPYLFRHLTFIFLVYNSRNFVIFLKFKNFFEGKVWLKKIEKFVILLKILYN